MEPSPVGRTRYRFVVATKIPGSSSGVTGSWPSSVMVLHSATLELRARPSSRTRTSVPQDELLATLSHSLVAYAAWLVPRADKKASMVRVRASLSRLGRESKA